MLMLLSYSRSEEEGKREEMAEEGEVSSVMDSCRREEEEGSR